MIDLDKIEGFEWDEGNKEKNFRKHKVTYREAEEIFENLPLRLYNDPKHSKLEERYPAYGKTNDNKPLTVVFTVRDNKIRIISARPQHKKERSQYHEGQQN